MNDPRSMMIGWGALLFAAGSGYYFARKDLNERKKEQMKQGLRGPPMDWREKVERDIANSGSGSPSTDVNRNQPEVSTSGNGVQTNSGSESSNIQSTGKK